MVQFETLLRKSVPLDDGHLSFLHSARLDKPLVLLPGSFSDASQFRALLETFPDDFPVIIVENRGHGGSWPPAKHGSIGLFARDVVQVLDALHVDTFFVGGHSIGGMIAIEVGNACRDRVLGIISIEGWTNYKALKSAYKGIPTTQTLTPEQERVRLASRERVTKNWTRKQILHFGRIWKKWNGLSFLIDSTMPIVEIYGDRGTEPPSCEALFIPRKKNIRFIIVENGSHSLPLQHPEKLAAIILAFLEENQELQD